METMMDGYERRVPILMPASHAAEDQLAEFLQTGRIIGGAECCRATPLFDSLPVSCAIGARRVRTPLPHPYPGLPNG
jgi:hypothetical protein